MFTRGIWTTSLSFVPNFVFQAFCLGSVLPDQPRCTQTAPEHGAKPLCFCFHCVHQKKEYSVPITDQVVPRGLSKEAGTQTLDADWKSLKSWLPQNGSKKEGKGVKAKHSTKLEVRVWQWLFRREKFRGSCQENISALAKVWKRK